MRWIRETLLTLRYAGLPALAALAVSSMIDQQINEQLESLLLSDDGMGSQLWALASLSLLNSLLFPVLITAFLLYGLSRCRNPQERPLHFFSRTLQQLYIETLRVWGSCLRWVLLLIVPAFIRLVQLLFVPFVVAFHPAYDRGDADALKTSRRYASKHPFVLIFFVIAYYLIIPLVLTDLLDPWRSYWQTPITALACNFLDLLLALFATQILLALYRSIHQKVTANTPVELSP